MPNRSVPNICRCRECIVTHPNGRVFSDHTTFKSHIWRNERASLTSTQQAIGNASRELFVTTLSEGAITLDSQAGSSRPTEPIDDITDRLSDIMIRPGHSSLVHHGLSSTPSLIAECSLPAAACSSPSNLGSATFSSSSAERPSLQEHKKSRSKYSQNQLAILRHVQDEILHCNMSLHLPIWRPLLDQARSIIADSRQQVNQISTNDATITQFKWEVSTLLDSLESHWHDLSSMLPGDEPRVYPTGKVNLLSSRFFKSNIYN